MAKGRNFDKSISGSDKLEWAHAAAIARYPDSRFRALALAGLAQSIYFLLIPHHDNYGRFHGDPGQIRKTLLPFATYTNAEILEALELLEAAGLIAFWVHEGHPRLVVVGAEDHQKLRSPGPPEHPHPEDKLGFSDKGVYCKSREIYSNSGGFTVKGAAFTVKGDDFPHEQNGTERNRTEGKGLHNNDDIRKHLPPGPPAPAKVPSSSPSVNTEEHESCMGAMTDLGISRTEADGYHSKHGPAYCLALAKYTRENAQRNPPGFFAKLENGGWEPPPAPKKRRPAPSLADRDAAEQEREAANRAELDAKLGAMTAEERANLRAEAIRENGGMEPIGAVAQAAFERLALKKTKPGNGRKEDRA